jgi:hypothetical protein
MSNYPEIPPAKHLIDNSLKKLSVVILFKDT